MVHLYRGDILPKLKASQPGKRMPLLCSVNRSLGWRILSENHEEHEKGVRSEIIDVSDTDNKENYLTSMAVSDNTGVVAIGSGCNNGSLYFIRDMSAIKDVESGPRFKVLHKESLGAPIHSLDWSGNHLIVGTNQGIAKMYKIEVGEDLLDDFTCIGQYINSPSKMSINASSYILNTHVKSAEFSPNYNSKDGGVKSAIDASSHFLTTTMNRISIWNTHQLTSPVKKFEAGESLLNCANWSPNNPQSLVACGGYDKKLMIIDTRLSTSEHDGIVWSVDKAHDRPIRDARFNPYIPYWLASAGEDSVVNIWDVRSSYHAPVAKIDGLLNIVTSVTWSNIRPENIGTTSSDGIMRYWTLSPEGFPLWDTHYKIAQFSNEDTLPITREFEEDNIWCVKGQRFRVREPKSWIADDDEGIEQVKVRSAKLLAGALALGEWGKPEPGTIYKGEKNVQSKGTVVSLKPAKLRPSMYYCITSGGQLAAHTVRFDALSNLRNRHRYDPEDKDEIAAEIEDDIYCRRISEANRKLEILKNTSTMDEQAEIHRQEEVEFLEDCLKIRMPIKENEWNFDSLPDRSNRRVSRRLWNDEDKWDMAIQTFKSDLKYWSYRIPPGFDTKYKFPLDFKDPIIAPNLLEQELVPTELPPFIDRSPRPSFLSIPDNLSSKPLSLPESRSQNFDHFIGEDRPVLTFTQSMKRDEQGLHNTRRLSHTLPILTINDTDKVTNNQQEQSSTSTLQYSANNGGADNLSPIVMHSKNPFEQHMPKSEDLSINKPISNNHFKTSVHTSEKEQGDQEVPQSTNPFVMGPHEESDSRHNSEERKHKNQNSWVPSGHRLSLTLSRHSVTSSTATDDNLKTPTKKQRFNPFKRVRSRGSTTTEEEAEERLGSDHNKNLLQADSNNRRNALHGPF